MTSRLHPFLIGVTVCLLGSAALYRDASAWAAPPMPQDATYEAAAGATTVSPADDAPPGLPGPADGASLPAHPLMVDMADAIDAGASPQALTLALGAVSCAVSAGDIAPPPTLTLIDYSRPSTEPRLWVFDLSTGALRFHELVAHGQGTGDDLAERFSDDMNSHQSSLGLFVARETYIGSHGYSLRLDGLEPGFNAHARERAIVMHGASYVSPAFAATQGRLGRSWGCPALSDAVARRVIDVVRDGGVIFSYYPDEDWLTRSRFLHCGARNGQTLVATN